LCGFADLRDFQTAHRQWVEQGLENGLLMRDDRWSESIAVGSLASIDQVKNKLGFRVELVPIVQTVQPLRSRQYRSPVQSFQPFNRFTPFKSFPTLSLTGNFYVSRILETSKIQITLVAEGANGHFFAW
jgi:hypothetical protein